MLLRQHGPWCKRGTTATLIQAAGLVAIVQRFLQTSFAAPSSLRAAHVRERASVLRSLVWSRIRRGSGKYVRLVAIRAGEDDNGEYEEPEEILEEDPAPPPVLKKTRKVARGAPPFAVGDQVEAYSQDADWWYMAQVESEKGGGVYTIRWEDPDDGDEKADLGPGYLRKPLQQVEKDGPLEAGEAVQAFYQDPENEEDEGAWYNGIILRDNGDGSYVVIDDDDLQEAVYKAADLRKILPKLELEELEKGMRLVGTVRTVVDFGAFLDVGAVRDGLLHVNNMYHIEGEGAFLEGDRVTAYYARDAEWYRGTVEAFAGQGGGGTYTVRWDDPADGEESTELEEKDIKLDGKRVPVREGDVLVVYVAKVTDDGKLSLTQHEADSKRRDFSGFESLSSGEFIDGRITRILPYGAFVDIVDASGTAATGLLHISEVRAGYVEDLSAEVSVGQEVKVRVLKADPNTGKIMLSMKELQTQD